MTTVRTVLNLLSHGLSYKKIRLQTGAFNGFINLKTVESTLSQIRRRRARGTSGLWPSSP